MVLPERISPVLPEVLSAGLLSAGGPYKGMVDLVEPATVAKVKALLNGRVCGWACLWCYDPALVLEALIGSIKKDSIKKHRQGQHHSFTYSSAVVRMHRPGRSRSTP